MLDSHSMDAPEFVHSFLTLV